jgi:hypothetical protein
LIWISVTAARCVWELVLLTSSVGMLKGRGQSPLIQRTVSGVWRVKSPVLLSVSKLFPSYLLPCEGHTKNVTIASVHDGKKRGGGIWLV